MTIGEKIAGLRLSKNMSQEELADRICVSRQSVSKWELNRAVPQIDKVLLLAEIFQVSLEEFLKGESIKDLTPAKKGGYFGTDGFRGEANKELTSLHAYKIGRFLGWYFQKENGGEKKNARPRILIGKDTRRSSYMLEYSIIAGLTASGADAYMLHVTTTPCVSFITNQEGFDCGIMITASHNPFYDNGIKIINCRGEKMDDKTISYVENYLDGDLKSLGISEGDLPYAKGAGVGLVEDFSSGRNRYLGYLLSIASNSFKNLKIGLDCANGASWMLAKTAFESLGAQVIKIGVDPNGLNINEDCGSLHPEHLCALVRENKLDVGFAFDGDCDRCIAVDEQGRVVDGDAILYLLGKRLKEKDMLNGDTVVSTVMSNSGLVASLKKIGIKSEQTKVGDRFVYERMLEKNYSLGGEQSGHIILKKYATTGDGLLTAIVIAEELCDKKAPISKLVEEVYLYPQYTENLRVKDKNEVLADEEVKKTVDIVKEKIGDQGRALVRASGTEPLIRVMIESPTEELCKEYARCIIEKIIERGYSIE